jgi:glycosyltransferase 2 family protein
MKYVWQAFAISLLLSVGMLFLVLRGNTFDLASLSNIITFQPLGLLLLIGTLIGWWLCAGWRIQILAENRQVTLFRATRAYILGLFSASVTPAATGQGLAIGWYLSRYIDGRKAAGIAVFTIALDLVFYAWSLPISYLVLQAGGVKIPIPGGEITVVLVAALALLLAWALAYRASSLARVTWGIFSLTWLKRWRYKAVTSVWRVSRSLSSFTKLPASQQIMLHIITAIFYFLHFGVLNAVAIMLGIEMQHVNVLALQTLIVALSFVIPTPGGSGYFEAALAVALVGQVPDSTRGLLILVWRMSSYWIYFLIGPLIGGMALLNNRQQQNKINNK